MDIDRANEPAIGRADCRYEFVHVAGGASECREIEDGASVEGWRGFVSGLGTGEEEGGCVAAWMALGSFLLAADETSVFGCYGDGLALKGFIVHHVANVCRKT